MTQYRTEIHIHGQKAVYKDVARDLMAWGTGKRYGVPAGTWQLTLSSRTDADGLTWFDKVEPQDFVRIKLAIGDGEFITVMNGLVNRVFRNTNVEPGSGMVSENITIMGLDMGKLLTKFFIWYNPAKKGLEGIIRGLAILTSETFVGLSIERALQALLDLILNKPDSPFIVDFVNREGPLSIFVDLGNKELPPAHKQLILHSTVGDLSSDTYNLTSFEGSIWSGFERWANKPWNELFIDNGHPANVADSAGEGGAQSLITDPDVTAVYLRPVPFKKERFEKLVTHKISYGDIAAPFSISKGDDDTYTCYFAYPVYLLAFTALQAKALSEGTRIIQADSGISAANRFGFRILDQKSIYTSVGSVDSEIKQIREQSAEKSDVIKELTDDLVEFFDRNPTFLQGNVTIKQNRTKVLIKVGQRVIITDNPKGRPDEVYYVVGVRNQWTFSNQFSQTLELQRGELT